MHYFFNFRKLNYQARQLFSDLKKQTLLFHGRAKNENLRYFLVFLIDWPYGGSRKQMRFTLRETEWVLDFLSTAEWYFVFELPKLASGEGVSEEHLENILPPPIVDESGDPVDSEDTQDWNEYVRPDIEDGFARDRAVVALDIDGAEKTENPVEWFDDDDEIPEPPPEGPMWRVRVNTDHTEQWYSTLNQTRLLLNREHGLAEDDSRFRMAIFGVNDDEGISQEKALLLAQYEFYSVIQNILVENIME